jgi:uncharacterized protein YodC (DUF2158 family)
MEPVQEFKVGDVVRLRSGGPDMTVNESNGVEVFCSYFVGGDYHSNTFPVKTLKYASTVTLSDMAKKRPTKEVIAPTAKIGMS